MGSSTLLKFAFTDKGGCGGCRLLQMRQYPLLIWVICINFNVFFVFAGYGHISVLVDYTCPINVLFDFCYPFILSQTREKQYEESTSFHRTNHLTVGHFHSNWSEHL